MDFQHKSGKLDKQRCGILLCAVHGDGTLAPSTAQLDALSDGLLAKQVKAGDITGALGETLLLPQPQGLSAERLLLLGAGDTPMSQGAYRKLCASAAQHLSNTPAKLALSTLSELEVTDADTAWKVERLAEAVLYADYRFTQMKSSEEKKGGKLTELVVYTATRAAGDAIGAALIRAQALAAGMKLTRDLANLPGNVCTPTYLAETARTVAKSSPALRAQILDEAQMQKLGMGSLLSVSRGSRQPAKLIVMHYKGSPGRKTQNPIVLVGKGLTFDAGGISIKPAAGMDEMKYDMCGGATVLGVMQAAAAEGLPIDIIGLVPSSENLPDGDANKPGDIVTSMSGQTIEILNTDAEGRLILCDALTYAERFKPELVIDIATLTGACIVALGDQASGLLGNDDALIHDLLAAGQATGDRAWQLPLWEEYAEQLKSPFADVANVGGRSAGTITAACFLARFTKQFRWAHLDIAGTAWVSAGTNKGATGRPVPLLLEFLRRRAAQKG